MPSPGTWRKSSFSGGNGGDCVELASGDQLALRDSKNPSAVLTVDWTSLVRTVQRAHAD